MNLNTPKTAASRSTSHQRLSAWVRYIRTFVIALAACIAAFVAGSVFIHAGGSEV